MIRRPSTDLTLLYESDETAWLDEMVRRIESARFDDLDYPHLAELLADMSRRDRREVTSRLIILLSHILKWTHQPEKRSLSWRQTIVVQQQELEELLIGVLRIHADDTLASIYEKSVRRAKAETGLDANALPNVCPYTLDELLRFDALATE